MNGRLAAESKTDMDTPVKHLNPRWPLLVRDERVDGTDCADKKPGEMAGNGRYRNSAIQPMDLPGSGAMADRIATGKPESPRSTATESVRALKSVGSFVWWHVIPVTALAAMIAILLDYAVRLSNG